MDVWIMHGYLIYLDVFTSADTNSDSETGREAGLQVARGRHDMYKIAL